MFKKLYLSNTDKKIAGVCGGIGEYLNIDPTLIRIAFLLLTLVQGIGLVAYIVGWIITPKRNFSTTDTL